MSKLRTYSSRAEITSSSFVNVYNYSDFRGNPDGWIEEYFDAFLYLANWGSRWLMLRLPAKLLDDEVVLPYTAGENFSCRHSDDSIILSFRSESEDSEWVEGAGWLASLTPVRSALMDGDHRALYLGWLVAVLSGEIEDKAFEPPVPPGLSDLDETLESLADFLRIDGDLITAAADCSPAKPSSGLSGKELREWLLKLPTEEKDAILTELVTGANLHLAAELRQQIVFETRSLDQPAEATRRTAGQLLAQARTLAETRRKREAERRAREQAKLERERAEKRQKHLESLRGQDNKLWVKVHELIATRLPKSYDEAISHLQDLRDLASMQGSGADFSFRLRALQNEHAKKPSLMERFRQAKLL